MSPESQPTAGEMLLRVPLVIWIVLAAAALLILRYAQLMFGAQRGADHAVAEVMTRLHAALRDHAERNSGALPYDLAGLPIDSARLAYRPPRGCPADEKLLIAHSAFADQRIVEFPFLRPARYVLFWSGRVRLVSTSAFERLIEADDAFRERLTGGKGAARAGD